LDESSPQTAANTQRLWSVAKPRMIKNTTKIRANTFGFYALNGESLVDFKDHSKKEDVCEFLCEIRDKNPNRKIIVILDNFSSHRAYLTLQSAEKLRIELVFLPPYSPDLNPIEFIWKSVKRVVSKYFIRSEKMLKDLIKNSFMKLSKSLSFARGWIEKFLDNKLKMLGG